MITFILPIGSEFDYKLVFELLIPSFFQYKKKELEYKFIILHKVCHKYILDYYYNYSDFDFENFEFIDEDNIYDSSNIKNTYYLQMLLKLMVSKIIDTQFYVTLDSDIIFTKQFGEELFHTKDKAHVYFVNRLDSWGKRVNKYMDVEIKYSVNQTPFIFVTDVVKKMVEEIDTPDLILNKLCSEYTVYHGYLLKNSLLEKYYINNKFRTVGMNNIIILKKSNKQIKEIFHEYAQKNTILVVQSRMNKHAVLKNEFKKYIDNCIFGEQRLLFATIVGGKDYIKRYQTSLTLKSIYCKKQMYDFSLDLRSTKINGWAKVDKMLELLKTKKYEYIFMSDADVTLTNLDIRIENIVRKYYDSNAIMYITTDMNSINSGNIIWKCCPESILFLEEMKKYSDNNIRYSIKEPFFPKGIYEQPSLIYLYNKFPEWRDKIKIIPQFELNSYSNFIVKEGNVLPVIDNIENRSLWEKGDFLVHYAGVNYQDKFENEQFNNNVNNIINYYIKQHIPIKEGKDSGFIR